VTENLHIVARNLKKEEIKAINNDPDSNIFWFDKRYFRDGVRVKSLNSLISAGEKKKINYNVIKSILELSEKKIRGTSVSSFFTIERMNFWFYQRFNLYMSIRNTEYLLEEIRKAAERYNIILYTSIPVECFSGTGIENHQVKYEPVGTNEAKSKKLKISTSSAIAILRSLLKKSEKLAADKHLIIDNARPVLLYDPVNMQNVTGNYVLGNVFSMLDKRFTLIMECGMPGKRTAPPSHYKSSHQYSILDIDYFKSDRIIARALIKRKLRKEYRMIRSTLAEKIELFKSEYSDNSYSLVNYFFSITLPSNSIFILRYLGFRDICETIRPLSVSASDENSPYNKCLLDAARSAGIRTIGIQHGAIHELHPAYRFTEYEIKQGIIPDKTLVWGPKWKEILIKKSNYPGHKIRVTGQSRTDSIGHLLKTAMPKPRESRVVLFASQPQRDPSLREKAAKDLFEASVTFSNVEIVLKPHPLEKDYVEYYGSIARTAGLKHISYQPDEDLYKLISESDAVYTCFSTVGMEAVYFSKPLLVHDPLDQDIQGYIKEGVGMQIKNRNECIEILESLVKGTLAVEPETVQSFIANHAYKIDNKASERIIEEITGD